MSLLSSHGPELPAGDEIDLRELGAALFRHKLWVLALTTLGIVLGGFVAIAQKPLSEVCLVVNITEGPKIRKQESEDSIINFKNSTRFTRSLYALYPLQSNLDEVMYSLRIAFNGSGVNKPIKNVSIAPLKIDKIVSNTQVSVCGSTRSPSEVRQVRNSLERVASLYRQQLMSRYQRDYNWVPPSSFWTQINQGPSENVEIGRFLALGCLGGLVAGSITALIADRRLDRVFCLDQLLNLLGYPLVAKLPSWPWNTPGAKAEIAQLAMRMDPALTWLVLSIGWEHPSLGCLVDALHEFVSGVDLQHVSPLLTASVMPLDPFRPVGVLVVVERGFNSAAALRESRRILASLSFVQEVGVVLVGAPLPPELRL